MLTGGAARGIITPQPGILTWGFSTREGPAATIETDLTVTALVLNDGSTKIAILAIDLGFLPIDATTAMRERIAAVIGAHPSGVLINFSHTHSAPPPPAWSMEFGEQDAVLERYRDMLLGQILEVVARAAGSMVPVRIAAREGADDIGIQRREVGEDGHAFLGAVPDGPTDRAVSVIRVDHLDGRVLAILFSYGCHPVVVGPRSFVISADFPAASRAVVEDVMGGLGMFLQGGGGDVMPEDGMGYETDCTAERIRIGTRLGGEVIRVASAMRTNRVSGARLSLPSLLGDGMTLRPLEDAPIQDAISLQAASRELALPLMELPSAKEAAAIRDECLRDLAVASSSGSLRNRAIAARFATWSDVLVRAVHESVRTVPFVVQVLSIGDIAIAAISAEAFSVTTQRLRAGSPFRCTMALGYSNGVLCYLPPADAYPSTGWSVTERYRIPDLVFQSYLLPTGLKPECEELVVEASLTMLGELAERPGVRSKPVATVIP